MRFIKLLRPSVAPALIFCLLVSPVYSQHSADADLYTFESPYLKFTLAQDAPRFTYFSTDSLGKGQLDRNPLLPVTDQTSATISWKSVATSGSIAYHSKDATAPAEWTIAVGDRSTTLTSRHVAGAASVPFEIAFAQKANHATVLGDLTVRNEMKFPCLLHLPSMGSFQIFSSLDDKPLFFDADRHTTTPFVKVAFPPADAEQPERVYTLQSAAIYPKIKSIEGDARFDGFRKNYINGLQINPRLGLLANNSASDPCGFSLYFGSAVAGKCPDLVPGLPASVLMKNSLDKYLDGFIAYGQAGYPLWNTIYTSSDTTPSLIISACEYIENTGDYQWGRANYGRIRQWAETMMATDSNGDALVEYPLNGNSGTWVHPVKNRPANWWDTIGFGHHDAYSNAIVYRSLVLFTEMAQTLDEQEDLKKFKGLAEKLKSSYEKTFYNRETERLAGWQSKDGKLHDYAFTFVNGMAIMYDLIERRQARHILEGLLKTMDEVGYTNFALGLPGNLISVREEDYAHQEHRWGYGKLPDGSDGFQIYENGGATPCMAYFLLNALYKSGFKKQADAMLFPMLKSFEDGSFEGSCPGTHMTRDWKNWKGECWGYEGFLADGYFTLLAVLDYAETEANPKGLPKEILNVLREADSFELLSLHFEPSRDESPEDFHDYKILKALKISDPKIRTDIVMALDKGIKDYEDETKACFEPHHGIRARAGDKTADLVICFDCHLIRVSGNNFFDGRATNDSARGMLDDLIKGNRSVQE